MKQSTSDPFEPLRVLTQPEFWKDVYAWAAEPPHAIALGAVAALWALAWWVIFARAGFIGALGLLMLVPGLNLLLFLLLAFGGWPATRELRSLRRLETAVARAEDRYSHSRAA